MKIRPLTVEDRDVLAGMVKKLADKLGDTNLLNFIFPDGATKAGGKAEEKTEGKDGLSYTTIGIKVLKLLLETLSSDVRSWFSSLANTTPEEFKKMPFDTEVVIIEQLVNSTEAENFFTGALRLYKKMQGFDVQSLTKKKG
jgi:hypothetical protein